MLFAVHLVRDVSMVLPHARFYRRRGNVYLKLIDDEDEYFPVVLYLRKYISVTR